MAGVDIVVVHQTGRHAMPNLDVGDQLDAASERTHCGASDMVAGWKMVRQVFAGETTLQERTFKWLATLPVTIRPMAAARRFPRIVNRIGDLWGHCEHTRLYLQSLLNDRRSDRNGFPAEIRLELENLQKYYFENLSGLPAVLWNAVPIKEPNIPKKVFASAARNAEIEILPLPTH
jgi:hypothetical protein